MIKNNAKQQTVLVVDDDELITRVLSDLLTPNNYKVLLARNGIEAIFLAQTQQLKR